MDHETAGGTGPESRRPVVRGPGRAALAAMAVAIVAVAVAVVLAVRLGAAGAPATTSAQPRPTTTATSRLTVPQIYQRLRPSVVVVQTAGTLGTGVIVANDGTILTANHVIAGQRDIRVTFYDGTTTSAIVVSSDPVHDIATLMPSALPQVVVPANLGGGAGVGAAVVAIGNPLGLTDSVSAGVVSGLDRTATTSTGTYSGLIQFDASVNPGSSGGPLLNADGLVIGIVVSIADPAHDDAFAGIGFAVPIGAALGGSEPGPSRGPQL